MTSSIRTTTLTILVGALCSGCSSDPELPTPEVELTLTGLDGASQSLDWAGLTALPAAEGYGGILNTAGRITAPARYTGPTITTLTDLVGGLPTMAGVEIMASDGYGFILSGAQVHQSAYATFDPTTGEPIDGPDQLETALASHREGRPLTDDEGGPLRVVILSDEPNQVSDGHLWVKQVARLTVVELADDWVLRLEGARTEEIGRTFFESGATAGCHGVEWVDPSGGRWTGIALWLLVGWVDDDNVHRTEAFNRELAAAGYDVVIEGRDGAPVTLSIDRIAQADGPLLAHQLDGEPLTGTDAPLRLVGAGLSEEEQIGGVEAIRLLLP